MKNEIKTLTALLQKNNIALSPSFEQNILNFSEIFIQTSKHLNLTAIKEPHDIMIKHYFDSIYPLTSGLFGRNSKVIDIGCGGGFPSIPLKLARPDLDFVLLDSLKKRLTFLDGAICSLGLTKITTLHARAEDGARKKELRDSFDIAVSRAVAPLCLLLELCLPYVKTGGVFIAYKGTPSDEEMTNVQSVCQKLGAKMEQTITYSLPENAGERTLLVFKKTQNTPAQYPRTSKAIATKGALE